MKNCLKISLFGLLLAATVSVNAQTKFGHLNSGNLLSQLPETKAADEKLKVYQDSLVKIGETRAKALQEEVQAFAKRYYEEKTVTPVEAQKKEAEFQQKQQELAAYEDEVRAAVAKKRQDLLEPILDKVQKAITDVGKEGSYTMIFDTSIFNTILFAQESDDVEALVKKKLGL